MCAGSRASSLSKYHVIIEKPSLFFLFDKYIYQQIMYIVIDFKVSACPITAQHLLMHKLVEIFL